GRRGRVRHRLPSCPPDRHTRLQSSPGAVRGTGGGWRHVEYRSGAVGPDAGDGTAPVCRDGGEAVERTSRLSTDSGFARRRTRRGGDAADPGIVVPATNGPTAVGRGPAAADRLATG